MPEKLNLIGKRFGTLTVVSEAERNSAGKIRYLCKCDCGNERIVIGTMLNTERVTSCGCMPVPLKQKATQMWADMLSRCEHCKHPAYKYYGAKGITVCIEWQDFTAFYTWALQHGLTHDSSLDRIDPTKDYSPENCRFISLRENQLRGFDTMQDNSLKSGRWLTKADAVEIKKDYANGVSVSLLAAHYGKCTSTIYNVLNEHHDYNKE